MQAKKKQTQRDNVACRSVADASPSTSTSSSLICILMILYGSHNVFLLLLIYLFYCDGSATMWHIYTYIFVVNAGYIATYILPEFHGGFCTFIIHSFIVVHFLVALLPSAFTPRLALYRIFCCYIHTCITFGFVVNILCLPLALILKPSTWYLNWLYLSPPMSLVTHNLS